MSALRRVVIGIKQDLLTVSIPETKSEGVLPINKDFSNTLISLPSVLYIVSFEPLDVPPFSLSFLIFLSTWLTTMITGRSYILPIGVPETLVCLNSS